MTEQNTQPKDRLGEWVESNMGASYTQAFNIRKVMYRVQDVDLPFKRGIRVEQFVTFIVVFFLTFAIMSILVNPILLATGIVLPWTFTALFYLAPPFVASIRIGKPMPHNKSIGGTMMSVLRSTLDDEWDARGMPVGKAPDTGAQGTYLRTWTVDPAYAGVEHSSDLPSTDFKEYENLDFPDTKVTLPGTGRKRVQIIEDEDEFLTRLLALDMLGNVREDDGTIKDYDPEPEVAPTFDRSNFDMYKQVA